MAHALQVGEQAPDLRTPGWICQSEGARAERRAFAAGFRKMVAYSPFPLDGLSEAIGFTSSVVPIIVLSEGYTAASAGSSSSMGSGHRCSTINVGGRPLKHLASFIPR